MTREEALNRIEFRVRHSCPEANGDNIGECNGCWRYHCNDMKAVIFLAQERPHGEWILCSERLPERDELVLVSFKNGGVHLCKYLGDGSENPWWSYIDDCCAWNNIVNAWMPLPEPYKKEGEAE